MAVRNLRNWTLLYTSRNKRPVLYGYCVEEDTDVYTSPIATINGKVVTTSSGNTYILDTTEDEPLKGVVPKPLTDEDREEIRRRRN